MNRQRDHFRKSATLRGHYMGRRVRKIRRSPFFGKFPGLPRLLARDGPQQCTMRLLEETAPHKLNAYEHN